MIISAKHRYVYVELPRTGSTATGKELLSQYDGERILRKHATYRDFLRVATEDEERYFVFAGIRNPLDDAVSHYFKLKTDHHNRFTDPVRRRYRLGNKGSRQFRETGTDPRGEKPRRRSLGERLDNRRYHYIQRHNADFAEFFLRYYRLPYDNWSRLSHDDLDFVIRFENLQDDFARAIKLIGLELKRPLPIANKTAAKSGDYLEYYTPETIPRANRVFGPYLRCWGYSFPAGWSDSPQPRWEDAAFRVLGGPRTVYWRYLRAKA